jgi:hypothetical protein
VSHGNRGILAGHLGTCDGPYDETNENDGNNSHGSEVFEPRPSVGRSDFPHDAEWH